MRLLEAAGLPPGVINMVTGDGQAVSRVALSHPGPGRDPLHRLDRHLPAPVAHGRAEHRAFRDYPRLVGETGGKDFVIVHPSADPASIVTTLVRGAFEYQGQKCSAASRAYLPPRCGRSSRTSSSPHPVAVLRRRVRGPVAVRRRGDRRPRGGQAPRRVRPGQVAPVGAFLTGGQIDDEAGYFVTPTILECADPADEVFTTEYFGPILAVHVYEDADYSGDARPGRRRRHRTR